MPDFPCARCASVAAAPLTAARFDSLVHHQQRLDHRASGSLALVAWAAAGALPASTPPTRRAPIPPSKPSKSAAKSLECAACRVAAQELALAASLVADCAESDAAALISKLPGAVCEHAAATGLLGHTDLRDHPERFFKAHRLLARHAVEHGPGSVSYTHLTLPTTPYV